MARAYSRKDYNREVRNCLRRARKRGYQDSLEYLMASYMNNFPGLLPGGFRRGGWYLRGQSKTSELYLNRLNRAVDSSIAKLGVSIKIKEWIRAGRPSNPKPEHLEAIISVYIEMRKRGYKHYPTLTA